EDLELDHQRVLPEPRRQLLAPLDCEDSALDLLLEPEGVRLGGLEAVEVHVEEREPAAVLVDQRERRAPHPCPGAQATGESRDEAGLSRAERPLERQDVANLEVRGQRSPK